MRTPPRRRMPAACSPPPGVLVMSRTGGLPSAVTSRRAVLFSGTGSGGRIFARHHAQRVVRRALCQQAVAEDQTVEARRQLAPALRDFHAVARQFVFRLHIGRAAHEGGHGEALQERYALRRGQLFNRDVAGFRARQEPVVNRECRARRRARPRRTGESPVKRPSETTSTRPDSSPGISDTARSIASAKSVDSPPTSMTESSGAPCAGRRSTTAPSPKATTASKSSRPMPCASNLRDFLLAGQGVGGHRQAAVGHQHHRARRLGETASRRGQRQSAAQKRPTRAATRACASADASARTAGRPAPAAAANKVLQKRISLLGSFAGQMAVQSEQAKREQNQDEGHFEAAFKRK